MTAIRYGAKASAVLFMLGLWAAGPQALGVAAADGVRGSVAAESSESAAGPVARERRSAAAPDQARARGGQAAVARAARSVVPPRAESTVVRAATSVAPRAAAAATRAPAATARSVERAAVAVSFPVAAAAGPADVAAAVNTAVVGWFDSAQTWLSGLPGGAFSDLMSGGLLLVRRTLFNQLPTADPYQFSIKASGQLVGTLGAVDPEGEALRYSLSVAPEFGTVQIAPDGIWTYTPGADFVYGEPESFTVTVTDGGGFNILNPAAAPVEVTVPIGLVTFDYPFTIQNFSSKAVSYSGPGSRPYRQPPKGYLIQPGEQVGINFSTRTTYLGTLHDTIRLSAVDAASPTGTDTWTINYTYQGGWSFSCGASSGNAGCAKSAADRSGALLGDSAGTYAYSPDTPGGTDALATLSQLADQNVSGLKVDYVNVVYQEQQPGATDWVKKLTLDNPSDNSKSSGQVTITSTTSLTEGSSWKVGGGIKWSPIEKVLEFAVSGEYGKNISETQTKTFTTAISQGLPPWSANEILVAPPKLLVNGDAVFSFTDLGTTYRFHNMDFLVPSQTTDVPLYVIRTEPLQPKDSTGKPVANIGFTVKDKTSPTLEPRYTVGQRAQLTVTAFNGYGSDSADYTLRSTYTSSDPSIVTVDQAGLLSAIGAGTATITVRYDWSIPLGGGGTRSDYVLATTRVTVV